MLTFSLCLKPLSFFVLFVSGIRDGAVVRALASHQCGPVSIPGPGVIGGLNLLLVLALALMVFLRVLRYSSLHKKQHFRIPSGISTQRATLCRCHSKFQCIYFIYYLFPHFSMCGSVQYSDKVRTVRTISRCLKSCYSLLSSTLVDASKCNKICQSKNYSDLHWKIWTDHLQT